ncbi:MAG: radical SAM/Cys-rich domain protein [Desulfobulbaceae bacterium]
MTNRFQQALASSGQELLRGKTTTLQVNVGRLCNLTCKHCHVDAGPGRREVMSRGTMEAVLDFARRHAFSLIDVTGGAPELVPDIGFFLDESSRLAQTVMLRTNLVVLLDEERRGLLDLLWRRKIALVASFPSVNRGQADAQRGTGVWEQSIGMLRKLNSLGYGVPGTGLELFLVSNPAGAFMPVSQCAAEKKFRADLARKWDISFTGLFTFANVPLGRFRDWLVQTDNLDSYLDKLEAGFNPATVEGLMCRSLINVSWDGYLYDCDFNMAAGLPCTGSPVHVSEMILPSEGTPIMTDTYCFACTAGAGFT